MPEFDDDTRMPWGQFVGKKLANIPAWYLLSYGDKLTNEKRSLNPSERALRNYVDENRESLEKEKTESNANNRISN